MNENHYENNKNENISFSISLYKYCIFFFSKEIRESQGLCFLINYFNKLKSLMEDINYYKEKKDWDNYEILIKK